MASVPDNSTPVVEHDAGNIYTEILNEQWLDFDERRRYEELTRIAATAFAAGETIVL